MALVGKIKVEVTPRNFAETLDSSLVSGAGVVMDDSAKAAAGGGATAASQLEGGPAASSKKDDKPEGEKPPVATAASAAADAELAAKPEVTFIVLLTILSIKPRFCVIKFCF